MDASNLLRNFAHKWSFKSVRRLQVVFGSIGLNRAVQESTSSWPVRVGRTRRVNPTRSSSGIRPKRCALLHGRLKLRAAKLLVKSLGFWIGGTGTRVPRRFCANG